MKHSPTTFALTIGGISLMTAALLSATPGDERFPIPVEELEARRTALFAETDLNGDGLVSASEFDAGSRHGGVPDRSPGGFHPHQDRLEKSSWSAERAGHWRTGRPAELDTQIFEALDLDADGFLSGDEFSHAAMAEARRSIMKTRIFERLDEDGDGYLTPGEFPPRRHADLDTDGDGQISREEAGKRHGRSNAG